MMRLAALAATLVLLGPLANPVHATSIGSIVGGTNKAVDDIVSKDLATLISSNIPTYKSMVLAFTECYGGNKINDFQDKENVAILSGSIQDRTTVYGGFHRALAINLKPGVTTNDAFSAAQAGSVKGRHTLKRRVEPNNRWPRHPNLDLGWTAK